eukprot:Transcript_23614.p1 GENE.Transcript_23614~~Transcript_23614.p1  ORF type:complete len:531 (-),score=209.62 Transcript_23614:33-1625(-)
MLLEQEDEEEPLLRRTATPTSTRGIAVGRAYTVRLTTYIVAWYTCSIVMTLYNKWLFTAANGIRLPLLVTSLHLALKLPLARIAMLALDIPLPKASPRVWCLQIAPTGFAAALDIGLSNLSFLYISVTYYTIVKSTVPLWILLLSIAMGLQKPRIELAMVVLAIAAGVTLASMRSSLDWSVSVPLPFDPKAEQPAVLSDTAMLWLSLDGDAAWTSRRAQQVLLGGLSTLAGPPPPPPAPPPPPPPRAATAAARREEQRLYTGLVLVLTASVCSGFRWACMQLLLQPRGRPPEVELHHVRSPASSGPATPHEGAPPVEPLGLGAGAGARAREGAGSSELHGRSPKRRGTKDVGKLPMALSALDSAGGGGGGAVPPAAAEGGDGGGGGPGGGGLRVDVAAPAPPQQPLHPLAVMYATSPFGLLLLLPIGLWLESGRLVAFGAHLGGARVASVCGLASVGAVLAFFMLLFELRVVQLASSLTLSVAGILKELLTVGFSVLLFGDRLSPANCLGLLLCVSGIAGYQRLKAREKE